MNPLYMMWPVTFAAELAFMLPTSSGTSALVLSTGRVAVMDMVYNVVSLFIRKMMIQELSF